MKLFQKRPTLAAIAATPVLALAIAFISSAFTQHASAQTPSSSRPFAVGAITTATEHVAFAAFMNKNGPTGYVVQELTTGIDSRPVKCFTPSGNTATISYLVKNGPDQGKYVTFEVVDNGAPVGGVSPDMYSDCGVQSGNCGNSGCMMEVILKGNIVVGD